MTVSVGKVRPSQIVTQWGPGGLVDFPTMSMIVAAIDEWNPNHALPIDEPRLAQRLDVDKFRRPPYFTRRNGVGGVPAYVFPRFLVCPRCNRLAPYKNFDFKESRREFICKAPGCRGNGRALAYPARYVMACSDGHIDDFPWHYYVHGPDLHCDAELKLVDTGRTGSITDIIVECPRHHVRKGLALAFGQGGRASLGPCTAARPWLADHDPDGCTQQPRVLLRGASNAYFPVVASAISIPPWSDPIQVTIGPYADQMARVDSVRKMESWLDINNVPELEEYSAEQLWDALQRRRSGNEENLSSLKQEEWRAFQRPRDITDVKSQLRARPVEVPNEAEEYVKRVVVLERLREVRVLRGFTRIDAVLDVGDLVDIEQIETKLSPIRRQNKRWLPGVELKGEGILIELDEARLREWEMKDEVLALRVRIGTTEREWREARGIDVNEIPPTTPRYVLLHTLSHLLMRQLSLDCGYSSASLRERIYSSDQRDAPMAGILIYTSSSDSDGSLGGLAEMGRPDMLGPVLQTALHDAMLCAGDPLCADRDLDSEGSRLNGAACHACLLLSETSCEASNHHLDRTVLVPTVRHAGLHFLDV